MTPPVASLLPRSVEPMQAVELVLGVARLGEADLAGWWSSQGMNPSVRFVLAGFRRTATIVGAELALTSAVRRHRQILRRDTAVHLFSPHLPFTSWARAYLAEQKTSGASSLIDLLLDWRSPEAGRAQLEKWRQAVDVSTDGKKVVTRHGLRDPEVVAGLLTTFIDRYVELRDELDVPYADLAR